VKVEIWSDVACPWCYIGKRRFEAALAQFAHRDEVEVTWRSFQLDPQAPTEPGRRVNEILAEKYGVSLAQAAAMNDRVSTLAAGEGLEYHLDRAQYGNTFDAHRLIHLAASGGLQQQAEERLFQAYFTEGRALFDIPTLVNLGSEIGVNADEARDVLSHDTYAEAVRHDEQRAHALGINGVPFFAFDERYGVSGAQPAQLFLEVLEQAWDDSHPLTIVAGDAPEEGGVCDGETCAIDTTPRA
jgi:predicted DsbA family dithiol-disulfide isomerase